MKNNPKAMQKAVEAANSVKRLLDEANKKLLKAEAEVDALIKEYKHSRVPESKITELKHRRDGFSNEYSKLWDRMHHLSREQRTPISVPSFFGGN